VVHGLRGRPSKRRIKESVEKEEVKILSADVYAGFGPTLASEYLGKKHGIVASKETVRQWMIPGETVASPREPGETGARVASAAEPVWRTDPVGHLGARLAWGRGEKLYLIAMIDDATSRLYARFVRHDSTEENMRLLWGYVEKFGRPLAFYTDKASLFQKAQKHKRDEPAVEKDAAELPPTQIGRALRELGITWIAAHSPQAKGRVERNFGRAQDRLVKGMRVAGVKTIEEANRYLEEDYLAWWEREMTVEPAHKDDAHRPLDKSHSQTASLSHVEMRQVRNDYTFRCGGGVYQIGREAIVSGLRGGQVRVEQRLDGSMAVRFGERYLDVRSCPVAEKPQAQPVKPGARRQPASRPAGSEWNANFDLKKAPKVWQAAQQPGYRRSAAE
jgi:hypothetical protein